MTLTSKLILFFLLIGDCFYILQRFSMLGFSSYRRWSSLFVDFTVTIISSVFLILFRSGEPILQYVLFLIVGLFNSVFISEDIWNIWNLLDQDPQSIKNLRGVMAMNYLYKIGWVTVFPAIIRQFKIKEYRETRKMYPTAHNFS